MSQSIAYKHYLRAFSRWPNDKLRPDCQFQDFVRRRIDQKFLTPTTSTTTSASASATSNSRADRSISPAAATIDEKEELEQVNAIYLLLDDKYKKKFALSDSFMNPASNPDHYRNLLEEMEKAPTRGWLERTMNKWKGFLRMQ